MNTYNANLRGINVLYSYLEKDGIAKRDSNGDLRANVYDVIEQNNWCDEYIHPIWEDIQETFYEETLYKKSADSHFNKVFRDLNPVL